MANELEYSQIGYLEKAIAGDAVPAIIGEAGGDASKRLLKFFAAQIRNRNTREAKSLQQSSMILHDTSI